MSSSPAQLSSASDSPPQPPHSAQPQRQPQLQQRSKTQSFPSTSQQQQVSSKSQGQGSQKQVQQRQAARQGALALYSGIKQLRERLSDAVRTGGVFCQGAKEARSQLRDACVKLLLDHYVFAQGKDTEMVLWKNVFYGVLTDYRRRLQRFESTRTRAVEALKRCETSIRKVRDLKEQERRQILTRNLQPGANDPAGGAGEDSRDPQGELARLEEDQVRVVRQRNEACGQLKKTSVQMAAFLAGATEFYMGLIDRLRERFSLELDSEVAYRHLHGKHTPASRGGTTSKDPATPAGDDPLAVRSGLHPAYLTIHQCFVYVGDLLRYHRDMPARIELEEVSANGSVSQTNFRTKHGEWKRALRMYRAASTIAPDMGTPHNQLAVLCTYEGDARDFDAVYHYFRSLLCTQPFLTEDNVASLFDKSLRRGAYERMVSEGAAMHQLLLASAPGSGNAGQGNGSSVPKAQRRNLHALVDGADKVLSDGALLQRRFEALWVPAHAILFTEISMEKLDLLLGASLSVFCRWAFFQHDHDVAHPEEETNPNVFLPVKAAVMCVFECERKKNKLSQMREKASRDLSSSQSDPEARSRVARAEEFFFASTRTLLRFLGTLFNVLAVTEEISGEQMQSIAHTGTQYGLFAAIFLVANYLCNLHREIDIGSPAKRLQAESFTQDGIARASPALSLPKHLQSKADVSRLLLEPVLKPEALPRVLSRKFVTDPKMICMWDALDSRTSSSWARVCLGALGVLSNFDTHEENHELPQAAPESSEASEGTAASSTEIVTALLHATKRHSANAHLCVSDLRVAIRGFRPLETVCVEYSSANDCEEICTAALVACERISTVFSEEVVPVSDNATQEALLEWRAIFARDGAKHSQTSSGGSQSPGVTANGVLAEATQSGQTDIFVLGNDDDERGEEDDEVILFSPIPGSGELGPTSPVAASASAPVPWAGETANQQQVSAQMPPAFTGNTGDAPMPLQQPPPAWSAGVDTTPEHQLWGSYADYYAPVNMRDTHIVSQVSSPINQSTEMWGEPTQQPTVANNASLPWMGTNNPLASPIPPSVYYPSAVPMTAHPGVGVPQAWTMQGMPAQTAPGAPLMNNTGAEAFAGFAPPGLGLVQQQQEGQDQHLPEAFALPSGIL